MSTKLDKVLVAIEHSRVTMETKFGKLASDLNILRDDHRKLADKVKHGEKTLQSIEPQVQLHQSAISELQSRVAALEHKADGLEGRSRQSNIRVLNLLEGAHPIRFIETWIKTFTQAQDLTQYFSVERAHRVPARKPLAGLPPRPFLLKLLHYQDRDTILRATRQSGPLRVEYKQVMLFPDYSQAVQRRPSWRSSAPYAKRIFNMHCSSPPVLK